MKKVRIEVAADKEATGVDVSMPAAAWTGSGLQRQYELVTPQAVVTVPSNMVSKDAAKDAKTISVVIGQSDRGSWPAGLSAKLGEQPAVTVELKADGRPLGGMRAEAPMMIALACKPTAQELAQQHNLMIWLVDVGSHAIAVPSARYDTATGTVRFEAMQFGTYAVGFNNKEFVDTTNLDWAKVSIEALAARGVIDGVGENRFAPQRDITRADFTVMLVRALGLQASGGGSAGPGADSGFADVNVDAYYAEAVGMAKELGFVQGKGDNAFGPRDSVSRQDMFTMAARALDMTGMQVDGDSDALVAYTDSAQVSDYAKGSLADLLQEGLLQGSGRKLHPDSRATRAEAAVFLNRVLNRVY
ncbi:S-layer homology domain-containing protein [Paenibacillus apiarius]|uniref:S-layer homology domain-containing protein n=1 Tax=Paenibacillus apiarius TaxID=46240 RepID=UPI003B3B7E83